jgi:spoIIIJ-associated protein
VKPISREKPGERGSANGGGDAPRERARVAATDDDARPRDRSGTDAPAGEAREGGSAGGARRKRRRRRPGETQVTTNDEGATTMEREAEVPIEEQAEAAEAFTRGLVDAFGAPANVGSAVSVDDDTVLVEVTGENLGLLVGPRGATLHAIEELVRTVVQRQTGGHGVRINVDVGGYRAKRREALEAFTRQLAERVLETGRDQALEPMSAADRKVVHDVAATIDGVDTTSEGEDPRRRVVLRRS